MQHIISVMLKRDIINKPEATQVNRHSRGERSCKTSSRLEGDHKNMIKIILIKN